MFSRLLHNFRREPPPILNPSICKRQPLNHVRTNQNVPLAAPSRSTRRPSRYGGDEPDRQLFAVGCRCVRTLTEAIGKEQRHADSDVVRSSFDRVGNRRPDDSQCDVYRNQEGFGCRPASGPCGRTTRHPDPRSRWNRCHCRWTWADFRITPLRRSRQISAALKTPPLPRRQVLTLQQGKTSCR